MDCGTRCIILNQIQTGFLADQNKEDLVGKRLLKYDVDDGTFLLTAVNFATIHCKMSFRLYPFDTQICLFLMGIDKDMSQQVKSTMPEKQV